jgi:predicted dehydrogenase
VEDTADVLLQFSQGFTANVHLDYLQRPGQHDLWITGTMGSIHWDNASGIARLFDAETKQWYEALPPPDFERNHLFLAEMAHFLRVVRGEEAPACTLEDGLAALTITDAVHRSASGGTAIRILGFEDSEHRS